MRIKLFLMSVMMLVSASSFAQFTQGNGKLSRNSENGWKSFYVQYNNIGLDYSFKEAMYQKEWDEVGLKDKMSAISIGYGKATPLSSSLPLFIKYGGGLQYSWYSCKSTVDEYYGKTYYDVKLSLLSIKAPIGLAYLYTIPNSELSIEPSAGLYVRVNVYGNVNAKESYSSDHYSDKDSFELNMLKDKDCNGEAASIFQVGCHIGFNISYANFFIGISYNKDLSKIYDGYASVKLNTMSVTAGIRF